MEPFIVMPTYNEADNLERIVSRIFALHPYFHIIVVDDNSPDGTGEIAERLAEKHPQIYVIHRPKKMGLGKVTRGTLLIGLTYYRRGSGHFST